jgi:uncharacterized RDD family membrane protein YckC
MDQNPQIVPQAPSSEAGAEIRYAGFWARHAAHVIDNLIAIAISIALVFILPTEGIASSIINYIIIWMYYCIMTHRDGATVGKKAIGIRVVSEDTAKLSWGTVILREVVGKLVSSIIFYIGYIMVAFTEKKQGLHDKIAGTLVIYKDPKHDSSALVTTVNILAFIVSIVIAVALAFVASRFIEEFRKNPDAFIKSESYRGAQNPDFERIFGELKK